MEATDIYDLADRYHAGELTVEEQRRVDLQLRKDQEFAKTFFVYLATEHALRKAAFMARLDQNEAAVIPKNKIKKRPLRKLFAAAAAVFAFVLISLLILIKFSSTDTLAQTTQDIYQERIYDKITLSGEDFAQLFKEKKYQEALSLLQNEANDIDPLQRPLNFEKQGFTYWQLGDWNAALNAFSAMREDTALQPNRNPAKFYLALTYLKKGEDSKGLVLLKELAEQEDYIYFEKAKEVLEASVAN